MKNPYTNRIATVPVAVAAVFSTCLAGVSLAGDPKAPVVVTEDASPWDVSVNAGLSLTDGNSDTLQLSAGFKAERITGSDEIFLGTDFAYGDNEGATTNNSVYSSAQYNRLLSDRLYLGLVGDFLYDEIASVDYRVGAFPTLGYYLLKNDRTSLALEVGAGYLWEDVGGLEANYFALRFGERFTHQLTENISLFQSAAFTPAADDFDNWNVSVKAGIEAKMTDRVSLQIYAEDRYDNTPAAGLEKNDFGLVSGLTIALGPVAPTTMSAGPKSPATTSGGSDWDIDLGAGVSLTSGNSDTLATAADLTATRLTDANEIYLGAGGAYGETEDVRNQERAYAFGQYNFMLGERAYLGERVDFLYDAITALDYRVTPSILAGYYLVKNDATRLALEAGPSYTWEEQGGIGSEYFGVSIGERFSHDLNDRVSIWQSAKLLLDTANTDNYVVDASAGFDVKLGESLSLRTAVQDIYDNEPGAGNEKNDLRVTSGLVISF